MEIQRPVCEVNIATICDEKISTKYSVVRHVFNDMELTGKFSSIKGQSCIDLSNRWYLFTTDSTHCWISTGHDDAGECVSEKTLLTKAECKVVNLV